jgi:hypothetical protein
MPDTYSLDASRVTSVWSAYGHRFMSTDVPEYESCLTCGAMYQLLALADDPTRGEYMAANGDAPMDCTGNTGMAHGYPGERYCHEHRDCPNVTECEQECSHVSHDCNCLLCA